MAQVTYYEFQKDEVDAALDHHQRGAPSGHDVAHDVAERVHNKDAFNILMVRAHACMHACTPPQTATWSNCYACVHVCGPRSDMAHVPVLPDVHC